MSFVFICIDRLLSFNPEDRITAEDALHHSYLKNMPKLFSQQNTAFECPINEFEFENRKLNWDELRNELLREGKFV